MAAPDILDEIESAFALVFKNLRLWRDAHGLTTTYADALRLLLGCLSALRFFRANDFYPHSSRGKRRDD